MNQSSWFGHPSFPRSASERGKDGGPGRVMVASPLPAWRPRGRVKDRRGGFERQSRDDQVPATGRCRGRARASGLVTGRSRTSPSRDGGRSGPGTPRGRKLGAEGVRARPRRERPASCGRPRRALTARRPGLAPGQLFGVIRRPLVRPPVAVTPGAGDVVIGIGDRQGRMHILERDAGDASRARRRRPRRSCKIPAVASSASCRAEVSKVVAAGAADDRRMADSASGRSAPSASPTAKAGARSDSGRTVE